MSARAEIPKLVAHTDQISVTLVFKWVFFFNTVRTSETHKAFMCLNQGQLR